MEEVLFAGEVDLPMVVETTVLNNFAGYRESSKKQIR